MVTVLVESRTVPPFAMSAYDFVLALPCTARTAKMAAVRVVLPWSMCPIVPTLTCGLVLVKVSLAIVTPVVSYNLGASWRAARQNLMLNAAPVRDRPRAAADAIMIPTYSFGPANESQSCRWDLNPGPRPYQGRALPTEPRQQIFSHVPNYQTQLTPGVFAARKCNQTISTNLTKP